MLFELVDGLLSVLRLIDLLDQVLEFGEQVAQSKQVEGIIVHDQYVVFFFELKMNLS